MLKENLHHSSIAKVSAIGLSERDWGRRRLPLSCSLLLKTVSKVELDQFCFYQIARFKRPKNFIFVPEVSKNSCGKVLKTNLRARLLYLKPINAAVYQMLI